MLNIEKRALKKVLQDSTLTKWSYRTLKNYVVFIPERQPLNWFSITRLRERMPMHSYSAQKFRGLEVVAVPNWSKA